MIQKIIFALCLPLLMVCNFNKGYAQKGKVEIGVAYGYLSSFTLYQGAPFDVTTGTPNVNFRYYLSDNVTIGLGIGFENNSAYGSMTTFSPECTFKYLDTKDNIVRVRLYGAAAMGFTLFDDWSNSGPNNTDNTGGKFWGFQLSPLGVRVGRKISGFAEIGYGYKGIVNAGISYRFKVQKKHNEQQDH